MSGCCCHPNTQSTIMDSPEARALPRHLQGLVAPLSLWEYAFSLQRRVRKLEADLAAAASSLVTPGEETP